MYYKQKTAYEMRISDWSSDVCSSDLISHRLFHRDGVVDRQYLRHLAVLCDLCDPASAGHCGSRKISRRSDERLVGKVRVRTCRSLWSSDYQNTKHPSNTKNSIELLARTLHNLK